MNTKHSSIVKKAAGIGYANAIYALGNFGKGVDKDECESFEYYQKSADIGHAAGMEQVGHCYQRGFEVEKNDIRHSFTIKIC